MSNESYIIDGARSPIGLKNGQMVGVRSDDLSAMVIKGIMERNKNIPKNMTHKKGNIKFEKAWFFREGNLMVVGNHLT